MKLAPTLAASIVAAILLSTSASMSSALSRTIEVVDTSLKGTIVDVPKPHIDGPVIDVPKPHIDGPVIDVTPNPPINDDLNDVLTGDNEDGQNDASLVLSCVVDGDDLIITNKGDPIPPRTKVKWAANGDHGTVQLPNGLRAGQKARIENVLDGDAGKCTAEAVL
jgi:hypothetical protein